ncbi:MAG: prephenate dehydratase [Actinomycetota bacterium]|nr:prephenate dehydratase [Actinomycetota bacterium]MEE2957809.1 prephenate dehydratase [Actinomycetota bacterium]
MSDLAPPEHSSLTYLGPTGTFTEQALFTQDDLTGLDLRLAPSIPDVFRQVVAGEADLGFAAIENSIEGSVNATQDTLAFEVELLIQREVVISIELNLMVAPGTSLADLERVCSYPHAIAQCRGWLAEHLPDVAIEATNSTADAARQLAVTPDGRTAAIAPGRAATAYGLDVLAADIEDHPENQTRFVLVAADGIPAPTGHDKTSLVVFQRADRPGSLLGILQEFAARSINLTRLESRPTKQGLGDYCFLMDLEGHISDELVADCLRNLHMKHGNVKFLGSYPAAGSNGDEVRSEVSAASCSADEWLADLRARILD